MAGTFADLSVAARLAMRAGSRRLRSELESFPDLDSFSAGLQAALDAAPPGLIANHAWLDMSARQPPWVEGGLTVSAGEEVSYFMAGRVYASKALDLYFDPSLQVWCRVGQDGPVFRGTRSSHSFRAPVGGNIQFGNYFPNTWQNPRGDTAQDDAVYQQNSGEFRLLVIHWVVSAEEGLRGLLDNFEEPLMADELDRIEQGDTAPDGWYYLWHVGPAEIFREGRAGTGEGCIHCRTHRDVGILQKDLDLPLTPETEISWDWRVSRLPSTLREDTVPSHDYLSIAVEFDDGRDITYYWSSTLPEGYGYDCPLPNWQGIEYHVVVRSGKEGLGEWLKERRNLYEDYAHYMGDPPARITRIWFIAVSIFQRDKGECDYADIRIHGPGGEMKLL
jgi:hypothetical protein